MKLNYKKTIFVGFAFFLICAFWQAYDSIVPMMLVNKFGLNHTERMLRSFGANIVSDKNTCTITPPETLHGQHIEVPGDISSAAFRQFVR